MLDVVTHLQSHKPSDTDTYVVAFVTPQNLFDATVDVFWSEDLLPNLNPVLPPSRSLQREWNLPMRFPEKGAYWDEEDDDGALRREEMWAVGDVQSLMR